MCLDDRDQKSISGRTLAFEIYFIIVLNFLKAI